MRKLLVMLTAILAAAPAAAQTLPPVRPIGATVARSTEPLGSVSTAVPLPDGKVLVNDILKRRVLLMDSTLTNITVVADSTSSTANAYGGRTGGLLSYRGDSALFVDPASMSMLVINAEGRITRVMSAPRPQDVNFLIGGFNGTPGFDSKGRLVYRAQPQMRMTQTAGAGGATSMMPAFPDSVPVVRFDLGTRTLDTAGYFKVARPNISITQTASGGMAMTSQINPIPTVDDWALLSDGSVAFIKGTDYSITWVSPTGERRSTGKVPYEWQRLDEDGKHALLDSARKAMEEARERMSAGGGPVVQQMGAGGGAPDMIFRMGATAGAAAPPSRGGGAPGAAGARMEMPPVNMVSADSLPDYRPAFTAGSARGDMDGNLWVRTTSPVGNAGPIYFVINSKGEVIDRVQLPESRQLAGFGRNGDVFLSVRDADGNARIERARIK